MQIIHVLTPEQRAILAPHIDRKTKADREQADADHVLNLAASVVLGEIIQPGDHFDPVSGTLRRPKEEQ
jgi:hypothetical protein